MQRLLLLIPSLAGFGGTERVVRSLSGLLSGPDRMVYLATFDPPSSPAEIGSGAIVYELGPIPRLPLAVRPLAYGLAAWRLRRLKKRLGIDLTISNLWGADLISVLSRGKDRKIALCHINVLRNPTNRLMVSFRPLVASVYRKFDRVIAVSEPLAEELQALYRLSARRVTHIENFVDRRDIESRLPVDGRQRFVWCGRMVLEKNVEGLLWAWSDFAKAHSDVQLLLLGDGPLRERLSRTATELGLRIGHNLTDLKAQVVFSGRVLDPESYISGARALLLSSVAEGLGMTVLEALSLGVPVLASDCQCGGVRAALTGGGPYNPNLEIPEYIAAGVLLPVPTAANSRSLLAWREALSRAREDDGQWSRWRTGALMRATHFTSEAVRGRWLRMIGSSTSNR